MKPKASHHETPLPVADRIAYLIASFLRGTLTEAEHDELDAWVVASDENTRLFEELTDEDNLEAALAGHQRQDKETAFHKLEEVEWRRPKKPLLRSFRPHLIAAATILVAVVGIYIYTLNTADKQDSTLARSHTQSSVRPGLDQAVLTLASGRTIILDSTRTGLLASEGGVRVVKGAGGELVYEGQSATLQYHTISIPRGSQYQLVLSDGTRVWLNTESSLRFPTGFEPGSRKVELSGEGYFEVAKEERPFRVISQTAAGAEQWVEVLGTVFNINAYGDTAGIRTTLLEGSVRVVKGGESIVLRAGEQAYGEGALKVVKADGQKEVAWKDGLFVFRGATIREIGSQITRWYDVEVEYRGDIPFHFNATLERSEPLRHLLDVLGDTKRVHFTLVGKKLIIEP